MSTQIAIHRTAGSILQVSRIDAGASDVLVLLVDKDATLLDTISAPPPPAPAIVGWSTTRTRGAVTVCANKTTAYGSSGFLQMLSEVARGNDGDYYAEVFLFNGGDVQLVGLSGFANPTTYPGTAADEYTIYGFSGKKFNAGVQTPYASPFSSSEDVPVVVGIRFNRGALSFSINGTPYPVAFNVTGLMRLVVGSATSAPNFQCASANVGQGRFLYAPTGVQGWERNPDPADPIFYGEHFMDRLHCILRPNASGVWYIQDDTDHAPKGFGLSVLQTSTSLQLSFLRTYPKAGTIQISSDDDFGRKVMGHGNLGLGNTSIVLTKFDGSPLNPSEVYSATGIVPGNGNLWIDVTMWE
jgi:hypothetical protein